jgi:hypothetical protein
VLLYNVLQCGGYYRRRHFYGIAAFVLVSYGFGSNGYDYNTGLVVWFQRDVYVLDIYIQMAWWFGLSVMFPFWKYIQMSIWIYRFCVDNVVS